MTGPARADSAEQAVQVVDALVAQIARAVRAELTVRELAAAAADVAALFGDGVPALPVDGRDGERTALAAEPAGRVRRLRKILDGLGSGSAAAGCRPDPAAGGETRPRVGATISEPDAGGRPRVRRLRAALAGSQPGPSGAESGSRGGECDQS